MSRKGLGLNWRMCHLDSAIKIISKSDPNEKLLRLGVLKSCEMLIDVFKNFLNTFLSFFNYFFD